MPRQLDACSVPLADGDTPVPVRGALFFDGNELPWFGDTIGDVPLVGCRGLTKLLKRSGPLTAANSASVAQFLANRFPSGT
ncbi:MAG TPA: hypothetical protein VMT88_13555 [Actinomycetes bacterium]|nr:hypothetical protein [Actinomycetes bacterium]